MAGDGGDQQGDWVTHGDFRLDLSEDFLAPSTAQLTPQRQVRYAAVLHSGVAIRGIFQKGEILCETFSTRVMKDVALGDWDAGVAGLRYAPGRQASHLVAQSSVSIRLKSGMNDYVNFEFGREIGERGPRFDRGINSSLSI